VVTVHATLKDLLFQNLILVVVNQNFRI